MVRFSTGFTLGSGITFATFQIDGSFISLKEELMILLTGYARSIAYSFSSQLGISSGPHAFDGFIFASATWTCNSDTLG